MNSQDLAGIDPDAMADQALIAVKDTPVSPATGIALMALSLALKFHEIAAVKDGVLYQQYKLEGRNMVPIELWMVFQTAEEIEEHLLKAPERQAKVFLRTLEHLDEMFTDEDGPAKDTDHD